MGVIRAPRATMRFARRLPDASVAMARSRTRQQLDAILQSGQILFTMIFTNRDMEMTAGQSFAELIIGIAMKLIKI